MTKQIIDAFANGKGVVGFMCIQPSLSISTGSKSVPPKILADNASAWQSRVHTNGNTPCLSRPRRRKIKIFAPNGR